MRMKVSTSSVQDNQGVSVLNDDDCNDDYDKVISRKKKRTSVATRN